MSNMQYSKEQLDYLALNYGKFSLATLTSNFNSTFNEHKSERAIKNTLDRYSLRSKKKPKKICFQEQKDFFVSNANCSLEVLTKRYNSKFKTNVCEATVRGKRDKVFKESGVSNNSSLVYTKDTDLNDITKNISSSAWGKLLYRPSTSNVA